MTKLERIQPIYLGPIEYDTLVKCVREKLSFENDDKSPYIQRDKDITMTFRYTGKFKNYMQHGTMVVIPWDSTVTVKKLNDSTFNFRTYKPQKDGIIRMEFIPILKKPYHLIWTRENKTDTVAPGEAIPLFLRSYMIK